MGLVYQRFARRGDCQSLLPFRLLVICKMSSSHIHAWNASAPSAPRSTGGGARRRAPRNIQIGASVARLPIPIEYCRQLHHVPTPLQPDMSRMVRSSEAPRSAIHAIHLRGKFLMLGLLLHFYTVSGSSARLPDIGCIRRAPPSFESTHSRFCCTPHFARHTRIHAPSSPKPTSSLTRLVVSSQRRSPTRLPAVRLRACLFALVTPHGPLRATRRDCAASRCARGHRGPPEGSSARAAPCEGRAAAGLRRHTI